MKIARITPAVSILNCILSVYSQSVLRKSECNFTVLLPVLFERSDLTSLQQSHISKIAESLHYTIENKTCDCYAVLGFDADQGNYQGISTVRSIFEANHIKHSTILFPDSMKARISQYWKVMAQQAVYENGGFFVMLGDDVVIHDITWIQQVLQTFDEISVDLKLPPELSGFGCVSLKDLQASGFPTFPVIHKLHFQLNKELFSDSFVNQDADPFLFQLYRRWSAARFTTARITNSRGGVELFDDPHYIPPRYKRIHIDWSFDLLDQAVQRISSNLQMFAPVQSPPRSFVVDIVVPTFRVQHAYLERICSLRASRGVDAFFIVIVDDPRANISALRSLESARSNLRVRMNPENMGAPMSRNVGLNQSAAEWVLFLDDDVVPDPAILDEYAAAASRHPGHAGFVGFSELPELPEAFPVAVHLSGVSFFWRAAREMPRVPWGVTANLLVRRTGLRFDPAYAKTGGGEDIDFCLRLPSWPLVSVPSARILHPWWGNGSRVYSHFYGWSFSDGRLHDAYPQLTYHAAPDAVELLHLLLCAATGARLCPQLPLPRPAAALRAAAAVVAADYALDLWDAVAGQAGRAREPYAQGALRVRAALEATLIRHWSSLGRLWGHLRRARPGNVGRRFDWFCGLVPEVVDGERRRALSRFAAYVGAMVLAALLAGVRRRPARAVPRGRGTGRQPAAAAASPSPDTPSRRGSAHLHTD
jgi:hypothetical protein